MVDLEAEIYKRFKPAIESWTEKDIYAISFFVYDDEDNVLKPTVTLGYNTETYYKKSIEEASDELEAKWNYAYWLQNEVLVFGIDDTAPLINQWIMKNGLQEHTEENENEMYDENMVYIGKGPLLTQKFVEVLIQVSNRLHTENVLINKFGKDIPIIIHELEYYDAIANETKMANPQGQAEDFVNWVLNPPLSLSQETNEECQFIDEVLNKVLKHEKLLRLIEERGFEDTAVQELMQKLVQEALSTQIEE